MVGFSFKHVGFISHSEHEGHSESASDSRSGQRDNLEKCPAEVRAGGSSWTLLLNIHSCEQSRFGSVGPDCSTCLHPTYAAKTTPYTAVLWILYAVWARVSIHNHSSFSYSNFQTHTHTHTCFVFFPLLKPGCLASSFYDVILSQPSVVGLSPPTSPSPVRIIFRQSPCVYLVLSYIDSLLSLTLKNRCSPFTLHCSSTQSL